MRDAAHIIIQYFSLDLNVKQELKQKDDLYVKDLKNQAAEIDLMIQRMEEQIKSLTKAMRDELEEIEVMLVNIQIWNGIQRC